MPQNLSNLTFAKVSCYIAPVRTLTSFRIESYKSCIIWVIVVDPVDSVDPVDPVLESQRPTVIVHG